MPESTFNHNNQLSFDSLFDELTEDNSKKEMHRPTQFIKHKRKSFPIQLIADFNRFMAFINTHSLPVTGSGFILSSSLSKLTEKMAVKEINESLPSKQEQDHYIHFFHHIAFSGNLIDMLQTASMGERTLKTTERWGMYRDLTETEQYFFLLETFWIDVDWAKLLGQKVNAIHHMLPEVFWKLTNSRLKSQLDFVEKETLLGHLTSGWHYFFLYLEWLGLWVCEKDKPESETKRQSYFVKKLTATPFGLTMIPILLKFRELDLWNLPLRREFGEDSPVPGSKLPEAGKSGNTRYQPFYTAFTPLFPINDLQHTLPRNF